MNSKTYMTMLLDNTVICYNFTIWCPCDGENDTVAV